MVLIGYRPILWHVMRYYAEFGHTEFILCLGYRADLIKEYFLQYRETISNDFVLHGAGGEVELLQHGPRRLDDHVRRHRAARHRRRAAGGRPAAHRRRRGLPGQLRRRPDRRAPRPRWSSSFDRQRRGRVIPVRPAAAVHVPPHRPRARTGSWTSSDVSTADLWINGGYFVLRREIFDYLRTGRGSRPARLPPADR